MKTWIAKINNKTKLIYLLHLDIEFLILQIPYLKLVHDLISTKVRKSPLMGFVFRVMFYRQLNVQF